MLYAVLGLLFIAFCLILIYYYVNAKRKMNAIVLIEEREGQPKHIPPFSNPLLSFPRLIFQAVFQKKTDFERFLDIIDKPGPFRSSISCFLGRVFIITWNPEICTEVFVKPDTDVWSKMDQSFSRVFAELTGESIVSVDGAQWKKQRSVLKPGFKYTSLKGLLPGFQGIATTLCKQLDKACEKGTFEPHNWMSKTTLDALGKCGFGMDFDALNGKMTDIYQAYEGIIRAFSNPLLLMDWYNKLPFKGPREFKKSRDEFWKWTRITIQNQLEEMKKDKDREENLLDMMLEAHFSENPQLDDKELLQNIFLFFLAGHETTSGTLTFVLDHLARHQDIQEKCRQEIQEQFELGEQPTYEKIKKLQYLNRVISETMRTRPLVSAISRQAKTDTTVAGYFIPKGTMVMSIVPNLHHDKDTWKDPMTFNPDRWTEVQKNHSTPYFMPFGAGPRICLGMNFANLEMRVVLINLLLRYRFNVEMDLKFQRSITLIPVGGYSLKISHL